jgi:hypothetical protein
MLGKLISPPLKYALRQTPLCLEIKHICAVVVLSQWVIQQWEWAYNFTARIINIMINHFRSFQGPPIMAATANKIAQCVA